MTEVPGLANGDSIQFWEGAAQGKLLFQRCKACGNVQFPPRYQCGACWDAELDWIESAGIGTVESFTIVRRAPTAEFRDKAPYVVVSVTVEEGPRMITSLAGDDALSVAIGDPVTVAFERREDGNTLPVFRRT